MKKILNYPAIFLMFIAACFLVSCEDETGGGSGGGGTSVTGEPSLTLNTLADLTVAPSESFTVNFSASTKNDIPLKAVTVYEDGTKVPVSRLTFNSEAAAANPALVVGADKEGLTWDVGIIAHSAAATTVQYEIEVTADDNTISSFFVSVTTAASPATFTSTSPTMVSDVPQDTKNVFKLTAVKGDGQLVSIEVRENDMFVEATRIFWMGISMSVDDNPFFLSETEKDGFEDAELYIMTPASEGTFVYKVILTDEYGLTSELEFTVMTAPSGTPVDLREDEVLNRDGMALGGLDLDTGDNVSSSSTMAELVDNGINDDLPVPSNWLQTISPVNGATMKYVVPMANGIPEGYSFGAIATKEEISGLYTNNTGEVIDGNKSTSVVNVGDNFVVEANGNYWLLTVKEVVVTDADNDDKYIFDVKY